MTNNKVITNDDIINLLPADEQAEIKELIEQDIKKWGGARKNSGRKPATGKVLKFTKRLTEEEVRFINYAREHHLNFNDLMQM